jgi:hypothetical protein
MADEEEAAATGFLRGCPGLAAVWKHLDGRRDDHLDQQADAHTHPPDDPVARRVRHELPVPRRVCGR